MQGAGQLRMGQKRWGFDERAEAGRWPRAAKVARLGNCFYIAAVHRGLDPQLDGIDENELA